MSSLQTHIELELFYLFNPSRTQGAEICCKLWFLQIDKPVGHPLMWCTCCLLNYFIFLAFAVNCKILNSERWQQFLPIPEFSPFIFKTSSHFSQLVHVISFFEDCLFLPTNMTLDPTKLLCPYLWIASKYLLLGEEKHLTFSPWPFLSKSLLLSCQKSYKIQTKIVLNNVYNFGGYRANKWS